MWCDRENVLVKLSKWLIQVDMERQGGKTFHRKEVRHTQIQLKQTLVSHTFFQTTWSYVVSVPPII